MGVMTEADVRIAQLILDLLGEHLADRDPAEVLALDDAGWARLKLELRGMLAGHVADVRTAGYLEGVQRGRQEAAHVVLDALRGEGLAP